MSLGLTDKGEIWVTVIERFDVSCYDIGLITIMMPVLCAVKIVVFPGRTTGKVSV